MLTVCKWTLSPHGYLATPTTGIAGSGETHIHLAYTQVFRVELSTHYPTSIGIPIAPCYSLVLLVFISNGEDAWWKMIIFNRIFLTNAMRSDFSHLKLDIFLLICWLWTFVCVWERETRTHTETEAKTDIHRETERNKAHSNTEPMSLLLSYNYGNTGDMLCVGSMMNTSIRQHIFGGVAVTPEFLL